MRDVIVMAPVWEIDARRLGEAYVLCVVSVIGALPVAVTVILVEVLVLVLAEDFFTSLFAKTTPTAFTRNVCMRVRAWKRCFKNPRLSIEFFRLDC